MSENMTESEYLLKICVLSKSFDLQKKMVNVFQALAKFDDLTVASTGVDVRTKHIKIGEENIKLIIVITQSSEFFGKLRPSYYRGASASVILFDKSDLESFNVAEDRLKEIRKYNPEFFITLVGVIGESEEITTEQGQALAEKLGIEYVETAINDRKTVESIFYNLTQKHLDSRTSSE
ncbi:MAG: hypothetical protein ACFE9L_02665 [Candidatus Hodarchaeota archaeon]